MSKLVTVVGGSGFIGRYVVQELAERGHRVRVAVRTPHKALFLKPLGTLGQIQLVGADVRDRRALDGAMHRADAAINLVGILAEGGGRKFGNIHIEGARNVAEAAAAAGASALVQVSAIGADAQARSGYGRSKAEGERAVLDAFPRATILRPSVVFGPEDDFINRFAALARGLPVVPVVSGETRFQPIYVLDVARAIAMSAAEPNRFGRQTFELGGPTVYSFKQLIAWIMREIYIDKALVDVPDALAGLMAKGGDVLPFLPMTSDQYLMLQRDNVVSDGAPGLEAFGMWPSPLEAIAPSYLVRYRRFGRFNQGPQGTAAA